MQGALKLGRLAGIEIGIHYTWLIIFFLVTWSLATGFFPATFPGWDTLTYWLTGAIAALLLFVSVLLHELSHSFTALARGQRVHSIVLFIFGGVSNIEGEPETPKDEFLIAVVGPLTSFAIAGVLWLIAQGVELGEGPVSATIAYLTLINVLVGGFNLIPGFPLDGGRILRAVIWGATSNLRKATQWASYVGQAFGFLFIAFGVWQIFTGAFLGGLWIAFIGWFLNNAAEQTRQQQVLQEELSGVMVAEVMNREPVTVAADIPVREFMMEYVLRRGQRAALAMDEGRLAGLMSVSDAKELPQEEWDATPIRRVMTATPLKTVTADTDMNDALKQMVEHDVNQVPVLDDGRVVGLLSRSDVLRFLQYRREWNIRRPSGRRVARSHIEVPR